MLLNDQSFQIPNIFKWAVMTLALSGVVFQSHYPGSVPELQAFRAVALLLLLNVRAVSN